jgi:hypothetical protein
VDVNAAKGASGGLCSGNGCSTSAAGSHGNVATVNVSASGGGGGGGRVVITTGTSMTVCE